MSTDKYTNFGIYFFDKENKWNKIANVINNQITKMATDMPVLLVVTTINDTIINFIKSDVHNNIPSFNANLNFNDGECITICLIKTLHYRRAKVYIFCQYSNFTKKLRILAYGNDIVYHSAICFGTSLDNITKKNLIEEINKLSNLSTNYFKSISDHMLSKLNNKDYVLFNN